MYVWKYLCQSNMYSIMQIKQEVLANAKQVGPPGRVSSELAAQSELADMRTHQRISFPFPARVTLSTWEALHGESGKGV